MTQTEKAMTDTTSDHASNRQVVHTAGDTQSKIAQKALLIALIKNALSLAKISIYLGWTAIAIFIIFGTISTLKAVQGNAMIYFGFHYLPYILIGLSIPISLYHVFLLWRYQLVQATILMTMICLSVGLFTVSTFMAMVAWFAMPYLFKVSLAKFLGFLSADDTAPTHNPTSEDSL
ncbi:MAG: hypothetical protein Q4G13_00845 [Moraxella sp.]|nr:hypothetical protein [Moraxella sp.]